MGRAIAERLSAEGFRLACHYRGSEEDARSLKAEIESRGGTFRLYQTDLGEPGTADALFDRVEAELGAPTLLVNNASRFANDSAAVLLAWRTGSLTGEVLVLDGGQKLMNLPRDIAFQVMEGLL